MVTPVSIGDSTDELTTEAQNDLQQATALARRMVDEFGMSDCVGPVSSEQSAAVWA